MSFELLAYEDWASGSQIDSGTITSKVFYQTFGHGILSASNSIQMKVNDISADGKYAERSSNNGGTDSTHTALNSSDNLTYTGSDNVFCFCWGCQESTSTNVLFVNQGMQATAGASNAPNRIISVWKFFNSTAITSLEWLGTQLTTDSNGSVLGSD